MLAPVTLINNCYLISSPLVSNQLKLASFNKPPDNCTSVDKARTNTTPGRGQVLRVTLGDKQGILRHYYRGGLMANISDDKFFWTGINRSRAVMEYRLLEWMKEKDLPVPLPLGARVIRLGLYYTCDIITREIPDAFTLAEKLQHHEISERQWQAVGSAIKRLHGHQVFHADLNANNLLLDNKGAVTLIDFDKCRRRSGTSWTQKNLNRLRRSLDKLTRLGMVKHFTVDNWRALLEGYQG